MKVLKTLLALWVIKLAVTLNLRPNSELISYLQNTSYKATDSPPNSPVNVSVQCGIFSIKDVNTEHQSFKLKVFLRLRWVDERISFGDGLYNFPRLPKGVFRR